MSGHSKWATIKHKKAANDKARGKLFAKLLRQVEVAAREGGGDPDANPTLRTMFQKARDNSIPLDTIERAVKRGTGELEGVTYEQITYEGYAPGGVAVLAECLTDNRNRTGSEVRSTFSRNGVPAPSDADDRFHAVFIRAPIVEQVGPGVEVLATVGDRPVLCRQGRVVAAAFHPELGDDTRLHQLFLDLVDEVT